MDCSRVVGSPRTGGREVKATEAPDISMEGLARKARDKLVGFGPSRPVEYFLELSGSGRSTQTVQHV